MKKILSFFKRKWHKENDSNEEDDSNKKDDYNEKYYLLSPTNKAEEADVYIDALEWALSSDNSEKVQNIAVTGPYGSGKSSIIKTFQEKSSNRDHNFLNISLATFKEDKKEEKDKTTDSNDLSRLIELSILQQIFYHEENSKTPESRFKKINRIDRGKLVHSSVIAFLAIVAYLYLVNPDYLKRFSPFEMNFSECIKLIFQMTSVFLVTTALIFLIFQVLIFFKRLVIKKIGFNNSEVEIDESVGKSVFNKHLDEILYFFEETDYNVVIIEDLDRFEQAEIFIKLRELNQLLNNSKQIKRNIVFIYAIKDEMFENKDRVKFFEFIIPIVPVVNSSNSNEKLLKIIRERKYQISEELINDISFFIDDMRLIYNIINEYHIYSKKINQNLSQDNLFSMIIYKNIFPKDFTLLARREGKLFEVISKKDDCLKDELDKLDKEIGKKKSELKKLSEIKIKDVTELRRIYIFSIIEKIMKQSNDYPFYSFFIGGKTCTMKESLSGDNFEHIRQGLEKLKYKYQSFNASYSQKYLHPIGFSFKEIESEISDSMTYSEREKLILNSNSDSIKQKIKDIKKLELKKNELKKAKLSELIESKKILVVEKENKNQFDLLEVFLRNGYINEDYLDYISIFYEGSITNSDNHFLINVKLQKKTPYDYKLNKINKLIEKIDIHKFEKPYILNYSLIDYILEKNKKYEDKKNIFFKQLSNESTESLDFIRNYLKVTSKENSFIMYLCKHWTDIWSYFKADDLISEEDKEKLFKSIIEFGEVGDLVKVFSENREFLDEREDFLVLIKDESKIESIVKNLELRLEYIHDEASEEIVRMLIEGRFFKLNERNLKSILVTREGFELDKFNTQNYRCVLETSHKGLKEHIYDEINMYVSNVYFKVDLNKNDDEEALLTLLNNKLLNIEEKKKILEIVKESITDIESLDSEDVVNLAFETCKIKPSWENVIKGLVLNGENFLEEILSYLNRSDIATNLSKHKINQDLLLGEEKERSKEVVERIIRKMLLEEHLNDDNYEKLLDSIPYSYYDNFLDFEVLSENKILSLIKKGKLAVNNKNFNKIKKYYEGNQVKLLERKESDFLENIGSFKLDNTDVTLILKSDVLKLPTKESVIERLSIENLKDDNNPDLLEELAYLLKREIETNKKIRVREELLKYVIIHSRLDIDSKLNLFLNHRSLFQKEDIHEFLLLLPEPFPLISKRGKRPKIKYSELNKSFIEALKESEYISSFKENKRKKEIQVITFAN